MVSRTDIMEGKQCKSALLPLFSVPGDSFDQAKLHGSRVFVRSR